MGKYTKETIIEEINQLKGYRGYVQFSHRPINKTKDIFIDTDPKVTNEDGFVYEAHFFNGKNSITIKQLNDAFYLSKTDIKSINEQDTQLYISDIKEFPYKIKMVQIWENEVDLFCDNMQVKKLKKVLFAGFAKESR